MRYIMLQLSFATNPILFYRFSVLALSTTWFTAAGARTARPSLQQNMDSPCIGCLAPITNDMNLLLSQNVRMCESRKSRSSCKSESRGAMEMGSGELITSQCKDAY